MDLIERGVGLGTRVGLLLGNRPEFVSAFFGVADGENDRPTKGLDLFCNVNAVIAIDAPFIHLCRMKRRLCIGQISLARDDFDDDIVA